MHQVTKKAVKIIFEAIFYVFFFQSPNYYFVSVWILFNLRR